MKRCGRTVATAVDAGLLAGDARVIKRCVLGSMNLTVQWYRPDGRLAPDAFIEAMLQACPPAPGGRGVAVGTGGRRLGGVFPLVKNIVELLSIR